MIRLILRLVCFAKASTLPPCATLADFSANENTSFFQYVLLCPSCLHKSSISKESTKLSRGHLPSVCHTAINIPRFARLPSFFSFPHHTTRVANHQQVSPDFLWISWDLVQGPVNLFVRQFLFPTLFSSLVQLKSPPSLSPLQRQYTPQTATMFKRSYSHRTNDRIEKVVKLKKPSRDPAKLSKLQRSFEQSPTVGRYAACPFAERGRGSWHEDKQHSDLADCDLYSRQGGTTLCSTRGCSQLVAILYGSLQRAIPRVAEQTDRSSRRRTRNLLLCSRVSLCRFASIWFTGAYWRLHRRATIIHAWCTTSVETLTNLRMQ